jgi:hypothetical protein
VQTNPRAIYIGDVKIKSGSDLSCSGEPGAILVADARHIYRFSPLDSRSGLTALALGLGKSTDLQKLPNRHSKHASDLFNRRQPDTFASHGESTPPLLPFRRANLIDQGPGRPYPKRIFIITSASL